MKTKIFNLSMKLSILAILLTLLIVGCTNDDAANESSTGKLKVTMTDAPFPTDLVASANVTINKIEIRQSGEAEGNPFIILNEEESTFNLLELTNGVTANLADLDIPVGSYDLIRLYVTDANVVLKDSTTHHLKVPSGAQTGIKVYIDPSVEIAGGLTAELLLDFDVSQSFVVQGNIDSPAGVNGFIFKPVIKAANLSTAGRLAGTVTDSLDVAVEGAHVSVYAADTLNTSSFTEANGSYAILGLTAGTYTVTVEHGEYEAATTQGVEIVPGNATTLDVNLSGE